MPNIKRRTSLSLDIRTLDHLALRLGIELQVLKQVAKHPVWHYHDPWSRQKRDGGSRREINAPRNPLKGIQRRINKVLLADLWLPDSLHAYRAGRSIKTATRPHVGQRFLWVADIRDFYPSISHRAVYSMFARLGSTHEVARLLTMLTTYRYRIPQGAPTSPTLANLHLRMCGVAARLEGLARRHHLDLSFFGDDILISRDEPFKGLTRHFEHIIRSCGLVRSVRAD